MPKTPDNGAKSLSAYDVGVGGRHAWVVDRGRPDNNVNTAYKRGSLPNYSTFNQADSSGFGDKKFPPDVQNLIDIVTAPHEHFVEEFFKNKS